MKRKRIVFAAFLALFVGTSFLVHGVRTANRKLHADLVVTSADIGIPGISKMYEARVTNRGMLPVRVTRCEFLDDTLSPGKMVAYAVQRWDNTSKRWSAIVEWDKSKFCKPYPLGIVKADLKTGWLRPGQSLSTGEEATAARNGFNVGDRGRFIVFTGEPGDYSMAIATREFVVDEHPQTDIPLRVRH